MSKTIAPSDLARIRAEAGHVPVLDVRTPEEFRRGHIPGAQCIPLEELGSRDTVRYLAAVRLGLDRTLYLVSGGGRRARAAGEVLEAHGLSDVSVLTGGMEAWRSAGLPVARERTLRLTLVQQALVAAGALVSLKVVFGFTLDPAFFALAGAVGLALVGLGMSRHDLPARLMARLPWNRPVAAGDGVAGR